MSFQISSKVALLLATAVLISACAKMPANPYRSSSAYSALPYDSQNEVQMLSNGELHYN